MEYMVMFAVIFFIVSILYYILLRVLNKKKKLKDIKEIMFLVLKYNLDIKKLKKNNIFFVMALINSFIISLVSMIIMLVPFDNYIFILLGFSLGFVILLLMIYACYEIYGRFLNERYGVDKNE